MKRNTAIQCLLILLFASLLLMAGCTGKHVPAWEEAEAANTMEAYEAYLAEFPEAPNLEEARSKNAARGGVDGSCIARPSTTGCTTTSPREGRPFRK